MRRQFDAGTAALSGASGAMGELGVDEVEAPIGTGAGGSQHLSAKLPGAHIPKCLEALNCISRNRSRVNFNNHVWQTFWAGLPANGRCPE